MKSHDAIDKKELLLRLRDGDEIAFELLYNKYKETLARKLFRILKSRDNTQEILQAVFVRVLERRKRIKPDLSFAAYLHTIASHLSAEYFRKLAHDRELAERLWLNVIKEHDPQELGIQIMAGQELMRTIDQLPPKRKAVFTLCKLESKSYKELSSMFFYFRSSFFLKTLKYTPAYNPAYKNTVDILNFSKPIVFTSQH